MPRIVRVLAVDDDHMILELLTEFLVSEGHEVVVAQSASTALLLIARALPDVVLLDVAMPRMDGLQALPAIKAAHPQTKVVVLSAFSEVEMLEKASGRGADAYLEKGVVLKQIRETIARVHGA